MSDAALTLRQLIVGYDGQAIACVQEFELASHEVVAIVGRSGCGKTTILRAVAGALEPQAGELLIRGRTHTAEERAQLTARTLQNFPLLHWLTVEGNLELAARIRSVQIEPKAILCQFSAEHLISRSPKQLSGGERCRASLAQATVGNPSLLLLDEPFTGLDSVVKREVARTLFNFAEERDAAVLFVTHDLHDACEYADRVLVVTGKSPAKADHLISTRAEGAVDRIFGLLSGTGEDSRV
jgi:ABC-type nitrate/sulfonate/bicarbonate transport system ATPase subunit